MIDWSQFTTDGGTGIRWGRVAEVGVGTILTAWLTGIVSVIVGLADIPLALFSGLANFLGAVVDVALGLPALVMRGAWAEAVVFVLDAGPAGYLVAIIIALSTFYVFAQGVNRLG